MEQDFAQAACQGAKLSAIASTCACEIAYFRSLLEEMGLPQERPTTLFVDNKGAVELSRDRKSCHRSRHVDRRFFKVRELVFAGAIKVEYIPTAENPADLLTKALDQSTFYRLIISVLEVLAPYANEPWFMPWCRS
jgi:hypothetical protein